MPIRTRLTVLFTLGAAVLMAVTSALFLLALQAGLSANLDATLLTRTADAAAQLAVDPEAAVATESSNGIVVQILTPAGVVVDGADVLGTQTLLTSAQARAAVTREVHTDRVLDLAPRPALPGVPATARDDVRVVGVSGPHGTVIAAAASRDSVDGAVRRTGVQLLGLAVVVTALAATGSWLLARAALRPVEQMRRQAAALEVSDTDDRLDVPAGRDELSRLATTFNELLGRLRGAVHREQSFVADAGHELRTPLTVLQGELELAQRPGRTLTELEGTVQVAAQETRRLVRLSEDLLVLARAAEGQAPQDTVDLDLLVRDVVTAARPAAVARAVTVRRDCRAPVPATVHATQLRRAVENIVANALRYAPPGSEVEVTVAGGPGVAWRIGVRDHGPGFPEPFLPVAFQRFTRADQHRAHGGDPLHPHGSGLGLAIVAAVMNAHGGTASATNAPGGGASVVLRWPAGVDRSDTRS